MQPSFSFTTTLWQYPGPSSWHFVTLPADLAGAIDAQATKRGWGSVKVRITIGESTWESSIFPDKKVGSYILPIKKQVRTAEKLVTDTDVSVTLILI